MKISLIAAVADNGVIGRDNDLPWHLSADLQRFKRLTMGHHLLVGRRTFEGVGRPLPGRTMVVISRGQPDLPVGVCLAHSLEDAIGVARSAGDDEVFVAGGAQIYRLALPRAQRLYLTRIHGAYEGDTTFPDFDESEWRLTSREDHPGESDQPIGFSFLVYERR